LFEISINLKIGGSHDVKSINYSSGSQEARKQKEEW
jgi:hypothetical protein